MNDGLFCVDHELLWIAAAGVTSNDLQKKHGKMYRRFLNEQLRAVELERVRQLEKNRQRIKRWIDNDAAKIYSELVASNLKDLADMVGVDDVHDAALYGLGEHAQAAADSGDDQPRADTGAEGGASSGDWRLSTSAYEPAGERQPEVPALDVHWNSK
jgi:hypothetical protein